MTHQGSPTRSPLLVIGAEPFRAFRDRVELELRPLTLLYGKNQAGKSTLLRLVVLLADSIHGSAPGLDLQSPALLGSTFKEMGWLGPMPSLSPVFRVAMPGAGPYLEVQFSDDGGVVPNRVRVGEGRHRELDVSWAGGEARGPRALEGDFSGTYAGESWGGRLRFASLLPDNTPPHAQRRLSGLLPALEPLRRLQWLSPGVSEARGARSPARCCLPDGEDLAVRLRTRKPILDVVSGWLRDIPGLGESASVDVDATGTPRIHLRREGAESLPLQLAGEGLRWLLPVLLCAAWAEEKAADSPTMLAIEEPEARLHPTLQRTLMERMLSLVEADVPVVLETHSVYILRAMQLAVAKGDLESDAVALYWVQRDGHAAFARHIPIRRDATLEGWEPGTFEEEQQLSREIFLARWSAGGRP